MDFSLNIYAGSKSVFRLTKPWVMLPVIVTLNLMSVTNTAAFELLIQFTDEQHQPIQGVIAEIPGRLSESEASAPAIIDQINRRFVPSVLLVQTGQYVNFPNSDNVRHHVYSFSEIRQFSTALYANENVEPVLFDKPGIAVLGCNIHDSMVAYVYVSSLLDVASSDESGKLNLNNLPDQPQSVSVWHPWLEATDNRITINVSAASDGQTLQIRLPVKDPLTQFGFRALAPGATR